MESDSCRQDSIEIDRQAVVAEPGSVGQRLPYAQQHRHGGDQRAGLLFVGVGERGELLGVVQGPGCGVLVSSLVMA